MTLGSMHNPMMFNLTSHRPVTSKHGTTASVEAWQLHKAHVMPPSARQLRCMERNADATVTAQSNVSVNNNISAFCNRRQPRLFCRHTPCNRTDTCEHGACKRFALYLPCDPCADARSGFQKLISLTGWPHETHHHYVSACSHVHLQLQHHTDADVRASAHPLHGGHCKLGR